MAQTKADLNKAKLAEIIRQRSLLLAEIDLTSGLRTNYYFNLRATLMNANGALYAGRAMEDLLRPLKLDYVGGMAEGAIPLVSAVIVVSRNAHYPVNGFWIRKKPKDHGTGQRIEGLAVGEHLAGKRVAIVEDTFTTGGSALQAAQAAQAAGAKVIVIAAIADRTEGAADTFRQAGFACRSLFSAADLLPQGFKPRTWQP